MNKKDFLRQLRKKLRDLPEDLVEDIIEDYQQHFESGFEKGKNETQICEELGNPELIANEYLHQYRQFIKPQKQPQDIDWAENIIKAAIIVILAYILFKLTPLVISTTISLFQAVLIFILSVIALVVIGILVAIFFLKKEVRLFKNGYLSFKKDDTKETRNYQQIKNFDALSIGKVYLSAVLEKVVMIVESRTDISVQIKGESSVLYKPFIIERRGSTLEITTEIQGQNITNMTSNMTIEVRLPQSKLFDCDITADLGSIKLDGNFNDCKLNAKMGSINFDGQVKIIDVSCKMGSIKCNNFDGQGNIHCVMGSVSLLSTLFDGIIDWQTKMGNVKLNNPKFILQNNQIICGQSPKRLTISSKMGNIKVS